MRDDYGLADSGVPPELVAKLLGTRNRQQVAEAMMALGAKPVENMGGPGAKVSWTQGLAQMLNAYQGRKGMEGADASRQAIAEEISKGRQAAMEKYQSLVVPASPGVQPLTPNDDEGNAMPSTPATSRDPRKAVEFAMANPYLEKSKLPMMDLADFNRDEDRRETREFQKEQKAEARAAEERMLQMRLSDQRISAQERRALEERLAKMQIESKADLAKFAAGNRPQPAPAMTTIVDPKDPKRMLSIDARTYQPGGSLGDPGVIGVAGKEPAAAKQAETVDIGRENVSKVVAELRTYYDNLDQNKGITNPDRGTMDNLAAGIRSSSAGQAAGRILGTRDQSDRNNIMQARPLLMQAVMKATGMTSKQLDSNAELKLWLATATDPSLDVKANKAALDRIEQMYGLGAGTLGGAPATPPKDVPTATGPNGQKLYLRNGQWVPQ